MSENDILTVISGDTRTAVAQTIDPLAFQNQESLYRYCLAQGDGEQESAATADMWHAGAIAEAYHKADIIIALLGLKVRN